MIKYGLKAATLGIGLTLACASLPEPEDEGFTDLSARNRYHSLPKPPAYREDICEYLPVGKVVGDKRNSSDPLERNILKLIKPITIFEEGESQTPLWMAVEGPESGSRSSTAGIELRVRRYVE